MFNIAVCGGTFDHLHQGHKKFLMYVFAHSKQVYIGVTSDTYVKRYKKDAAFISPVGERITTLWEFLNEKKLQDRATISPIDSVLYPKTWNTIAFEAIFVTKDSFQGALVINSERQGKGLPSLEVVIVPLLLNTEHKVVSSTFIRQKKPILKKILLTTYFEQTYLLPNNQREKLHRPFGEVVSLKEIDFSSLHGEKIITVGDVITRDFNKNNVNQWISIIDFTVQRKRIYKSVTDLGFTGSEIILSADNPAGHLTPSLWSTFDYALSLRKKRIVIHVSGEEDLAVLPAIMLAKTGTVLYYGQPYEGIVRVEVAAKTKAKAGEIIADFEVASTRGY